MTKTLDNSPIQGIVRVTLLVTLPTTDELTATAEAVLERLEVEYPKEGENGARTPITGAAVGFTRGATGLEVDAAVERANAAFASWRLVPPPRRGELVRRLGQLLREHKDDLAELVTLEAGKIAGEARGEVQEMIDMCDLAVGLSRQLFGLTLASERPEHRMTEVWQPLGVCAVITSFNFPVAVWAWNAALALVCGDPVIWKPSEKTVLTALACQSLVAQAAEAAGAPAHVSQVLLGGPDVGHALVDHPGVALVSATGSTAMGRAVGPRVAARFGRCLLELGGNNAAIVAPSADLNLAVRAIVFAAAGTAGQRCTTLRRLIVHTSVHDDLVERVAAAYQTLRVGDPRHPGTLVGPLIDGRAFEAFRHALAQAEADGGHVVTGGQRDLGLAEQAPEAYYVRPALATMPTQSELVLCETFAPLLYVLRYEEWDDAMAVHNAARHGLSSSIFTNDLREAERFVSPGGSDCGIANVNIGPSGAEIGGAFGGEKDTGGGREAGSDAWKAYMRRQTTTVNYGHDLPLAQGVEFG